MQKNPFLFYRFLYKLIQTISTPSHYKNRKTSKKLACARLVDHDDRYQLENAAKFRAVNQQVATYDEFKAIVDGCHLKVSYKIFTILESRITEPFIFG